MITKKDKIKFFNKIASQRPYWRQLNSYYYQELEKLITFLVPPGKKVLDLGCGTGELLAKVKPSLGVGIDFSYKMIKIARKKHPHLKFIVADAENLPLREKFDYILLSDLIGHLEDIEETFLKLKELAHPGTRIIVTYYNFLWEPLLKLGEKLRLKMAQYQQNWLSSDEIKNFLYISDWETIKEGSRFLVPVKLPGSDFINKYISPLWPWRKLSLINWLVAKPLLSKRSDCSVSVIIPARNEAGNIEKAIERLPKLGKSMEIIFVEGNSTDHTWEEIKRVAEKYSSSHKIHYFKQEGRGKFDAVKKGFEKARGELLMILDADLTVPPEELPKFYRAFIKDKGEFINGSRLVYPMEEGAMRFFNMLGNKFFSILFSWLLNQSFKDTLCGTKVLTKKSWEEMLQYKDYLGDFDPFGDFFLLFNASKLNLKITEIPVHYKSRSYGTTNIRRWYHGWQLLKLSFHAMKKLKFF